MAAPGLFAAWFAAALALAACDAAERPAAPANALNETVPSRVPPAQPSEANGAEPDRAGTAEFPPLSGRVVDQAELLAPEAETRLSETLAELERRTTDQLVIVTIGSLGGRSIADYARALGNHWGLGKARANGVLLLVAPREQQVRIAVGRGLEPILTNARAAEIIRRDLIPAFRDSRWEEGVAAGTASIIAVLTDNAAEPRRQTS
jgi:uncharacterized membrane protein YgcG